MVRTGPRADRAMRAAFVEESRPPDRKTPNGTSAIMRLRTASPRRSFRRLAAASAEMSRSSAVRPGEIGCHQDLSSVDPSERTIIHEAGGSFEMPENIVRGGGTKANVR